MPSLSYSNILILTLAVMLTWYCVKLLIAVYRLHQSYEMTPNRFLYPASCRPENCRNPAGFIAFITPRLTAFGVLGLLISAFLLVSTFTGILDSTPGWFSKSIAFFLFLPLFIWYVVFINKAAKRFW